MHILRRMFQRRVQVYREAPSVLAHILPQAHIHNAGEAYLAIHGKTRLARMKAVKAVGLILAVVTMLASLACSSSDQRAPSNASGGEDFDSAHNVRFGRLPV